MTHCRKYRPPYTRKPDPALLAADALWREAKAEERRRDAELAAMRLEIADQDDAYEWGGSL